MFRKIRKQMGFGNVVSSLIQVYVTPVPVLFIGNQLLFYSKLFFYNYISCGTNYIIKII